MASAHFKIGLLPSRELQTFAANHAENVRIETQSGLRWIISEAIWCSGHKRCLLRALTGKNARFN
jgi:hypothetical protein